MSNLDILNQYVERGLLNQRVSPCGKLVLYDYSEKCQFEKAWDDVTLNHRGSVYELETGKLVARAFPKFFNFSELPQDRQAKLLESQNFSVYEKVDGSLGIIYYYNRTWRVNTRGSFTSDQAIKGLELLQREETQYLNKHCTYLVEIIYPENRIVVDYKGQEKLVLLAEIDTAGGEETSPQYREIIFEHEAEEYSFDTISEVLDKLKLLPFNEEGYVVQFEDGSRAKFKGDEYVEMHRLISGLSPLTLWERMEYGKIPKDFLATIPEEFRPTYEDLAGKLEEEYEKTFNAIKFQASSIAHNELFIHPADFNDSHRKPLGLYLKNNPDELSSFMFPILLKKTDDLHKMIKKHIRPTGNQI